MPSNPSRSPAGDPVTARVDADVLARARDAMGRRAVREAARRIRRGDARVIRDQRELTEIPAPPFGEEARARRMAELMDEAGLADVGLDGVGNVLGRVPGGDGGGAPTVVSAHLDTVFPEGTDVSVRKRGDRWVGPGIADDGRGLAALLALGRTLCASPELVAGPVLFAATVGEEGAGDLRGARHLFREGGPCRDATAFLSLDGAGLDRVVTSGLGSRRFRIRVRGPGGHSWVAWGTANPIHALGRVVAACASLPLPGAPPTTLTVARWGGGTSVNAIPQEAWVELEVRSTEGGPLDRLSGAIRDAVAEAVRAENEVRARGTEPVYATVEVIGDRPPGRTEPGSALVRAAVAATVAVGGQPELAVSSTDANVPMSLGVPAVTLGAGGEAGLAHTTDEWFRNTRGPEGVLRSLLTVLLVSEDGADG